MIDKKQIDPEKIVSDLIDIFTIIPQIYDENDKEVVKRDYERSDLDHLIELTTFGGVQGFKLAKMIQENRQHRREAKDQNFVLRPLYDFVVRNQNILNQLRKVQMDTMKQIKAQNERRYHPRSDHPEVLKVFGSDEEEVSNA